jgi:hypothetical protein
MTQELSESLEELEADREIYRTLLKGLNLDISKRKLELKELLDRWEVLNKEYSILDRAIADRTKVTILKTKYAPRDPKTMTAKGAQEMLALLGVSLDAEEPEEPQYEEELDVAGSLEILEGLISEGS